MPEAKDDEISISRAKLESITVYDVMEEELETIERGSPSSLYLNFSISLLSIFVSLLFSLLTTTILDDRVYQAFITVCAISGIAGVVLFILWLHTNKESRSVFAKIRSRKSAGAIREKADESIEEDAVS